MSTHGQTDGDDEARAACDDTADLCAVDETVEQGQPGPLDTAPSPPAAAPSRLGVRLEPTAPFRSVWWRDTANDETWPEYVERYMTWKKDNRGNRTLVGLNRYLGLSLLFALILGTSLGPSVAFESIPGGGVGEVLVLPYKDSYERRFPDCVPAGHAAPPPVYPTAEEVQAQEEAGTLPPDPPKMSPREKRAARRAADRQAVLVVDLMNRASVITHGEFSARKRARNRALAEVWIVGACSRVLPRFDESSIEPIGLDDFRATTPTTEPSTPATTQTPAGER